MPIFLEEDNLGPGSFLPTTGAPEMLSRINQICVNTFGQAVTLSRVVSDPLGTDETMGGIMEAGIEPEDRPPGDDSIYARLWMNASDLVTPVQKGDEITNGSTIYLILRIQEDAGGGLWMLLRKDRSA